MVLRLSVQGVRLRVSKFRASKVECFEGLEFV